MRILLTNDDGIHAPGLAYLIEAAKTLSADIWVVAPDREQSCKGRALTTQDALRIQDLGNKQFSINGTPADCVILAIQHLMAEQPPDLVLSGINRGLNAAEDVLYSGTVGAAMEAAMNKIPAIALSQMRPHHSIRSEKTIEETYDSSRKLSAKLIQQSLPILSDFKRGEILNINFPPVLASEISGVEITQQGTQDAYMMKTVMTKDARNLECHWLGFERHVPQMVAGTDLAALAAGKISITPLQPNMTAISRLEALKRQFIDQNE